MTAGAQRVETQQESVRGTVEASPAEVQYEPAGESWVADEPEERGSGGRLVGGLLLLLALAWTAAAIWSIRQSGATLTLPNAVSWIGLVSTPLVLIGILWLVFGRTARRETERFTRAVQALRRESESLNNVLDLVAMRLEDSQAKLTGETAQLMTLGEEASDRLGRVTHYLSKESANLNRNSEALENAANAARIDIGVLLHDLPRAEEQARAVAEAMKGAGLAAHEQAGALEGQLAALTARGREADEVVGGAAQRLGAHLARIESTTATASTRMGEAADSMTAAVDGTMARAAEAVDSARAGLEAQGAAMLAMIEQSRAALERAGEDAGRNLAQRIESIGSKIEGLASHLAAQDAASQAFVTSLARELSDLDERFADIGRTADGNTERLSAAIEGIRSSVGGLVQELDGGHERASYLIDRAQDMSTAIAGVTEQLNAVPSSLASVEEQAIRTRGSAEAIAPAVEAMAARADDAVERLSLAEASAGRQREAVEELVARLDMGLRASEAQARELSVALAQADDAAARLVSTAAPELVDALVRVRETAQQAANHAREAISAIIPQSAAALEQAAARALTGAIDRPVREKMGELDAVTERAVEAARAASERLTRQLVAIGQSAAAIEARIEEADAERARRDQEGLSRTVSLLIESLNSTAIDVNKILSNDVDDSAWRAYLRGDRGVFTRRAVRLLDANEAREIAQHYDSEGEFRDQVNRYIADFEAMLRRLLADREGSAIAVTLLSSDMGKLYVALAQAIERLRA